MLTVTLPWPARVLHPNARPLMQAVLTPEEFRGFLKGNVIKYAMRQGKKEGSDDAGKARHYQQFLDATRDA